MKVRALVGAGDRIGLAFLPFAVVGLVLNVVFPEVFEVGGPPEWLRMISDVVLAVGLGFLLDSWLGAALGVVLYVAAQGRGVSGRISGVPNSRSRPSPATDRYQDRGRR